MDENANTQQPAESTRSESSVIAHARIVDALNKLAICVRSQSQYGCRHPVIVEMAEAVQQALAELLVLQPTLGVAVGSSYLALDTFPVEDKNGCLAGFAEMLHLRNVGLLRLSAGVTLGEVIELAEVLSLSPEDLNLRGGIETEMANRPLTHIQAKVGLLPAESREGRDAADIYEEALILVEEAMKAIQSGLRIPVPEIRAVVADTLHSLMSDDKALLALAGIRSYDRYLAEHSVNVCILSMVFGRDLGLDPATSLELGISGMLHDVGKVFVPGDVVKKPGRLTEEEWEMMRKHPTQGARALAGLHELPALASTIALQHHARSNGTGYPALPAGQKPHLLSRLVAIVDTYDALTTERPYRDRWSPQTAIAWMLYEAPGQYDRQILARLASRARLYPVGAMVRLKSGHHAVVVGGSHENPLRPTLKLVGQGASETIDLSTTADTQMDIDAMAQPVEVLLPYADSYLAA